MKRTNDKVTMPTACWRTLRDIIGAPGWATTAKVIVVAGGLSLRMDKDGGDIKIADYPKTVTPETERAWADKPITAEMQSREQDVIEKCINFHIEKGAFGGSKYGKILIEQFIDVS